MKKHLLNFEMSTLRHRSGVWYSAQCSLPAPLCHLAVNGRLEFSPEQVKMHILFLMQLYHLPCLPSNYFTLKSMRIAGRGLTRWPPLQV